MTNRILVDKDTGQEFEARLDNDLNSEIYRLREIKPEPKVVDWSKVSAEANIPAKFWKDDQESLSFFGGFGGNKNKSFTPDGWYWDTCTLVTGIPVPWFGGECPLPEGVMIKPFLRNGDNISETKATGVAWYHSKDSITGTKHGGDIIAFEITGLEDGYVFNKG